MADLCLGAPIAGVNTLMGIGIALIIVICEGAASVVASVIRPTTAIFAPPRVDFAARLYWWRYLANADRHAGHLWSVGLADGFFISTCSRSVGDFSLKS